MNTHVSDLLIFGAIAITTGVLILFSLVRELAPVQRRKWLLGAALGTGVIAFSLKIGMIILFSSFPREILAMFPRQEYQKNQNPFVFADERLTETLDEAYTWAALPRTAPSPADNPATPQKIALGKKLFFDKRLSADGTLSCASCHVISPEKGGGDGQPVSVGINGQKGQRNAPTVLNAAFQRVLFWDGRAASLEEQAKEPLVNPIEMGMPSLEQVEARINDLPEYKRAFSQVFPGNREITIGQVAKVIAAYERTLITPDSPYDHFVNGDSDALSPQQIRGMALFESTGCVICHSGPNFSGASIYSEESPYRMFPANPNSGYETQYDLTADRGAADGQPGSQSGVWRIPSLRNVSRTAPYFHNGSVDSLEAAVRIMARVQLDRKLSNSPADAKRVQWQASEKQFTVETGRALSDAEVGDIVAFLKSLDGKLP